MPLAATPERFDGRSASGTADPISARETKAWRASRWNASSACLPRMNPESRRRPFCRCCESEPGILARVPAWRSLRRSLAAVKPEPFSGFLDYTVTSAGKGGILSRHTIASFAITAFLGGVWNFGEGGVTEHGPATSGIRLCQRSRKHNTATTEPGLTFTRLSLSRRDRGV